MSNPHYQPPAPTDPQQAPLQGPRRRPRRNLKRWILPAGMLLGGIVLGTTAAGGTPEPVTVEVPGPERIVEKEVPVPGPVETKTVEVPGPETVPAVCTEALDLADQGFTIAGEVMTALQAGLASGDFSGADAGNEKLSTLAPKYNAAKTACRAAAE